MSRSFSSRVSESYSFEVISAAFGIISVALEIISVTFETILVATEIVSKLGRWTLARAVTGTIGLFPGRWLRRLLGLQKSGPVRSYS